MNDKQLLCIKTIKDLAHNIIPQTPVQKNIADIIIKLAEEIIRENNNVKE